MLIQPDTTIRLLSGVPLDKSYEHTIYFNYIYEQYNYFNSHAKHRLTKQSFQRYDKGVLHIQIPVEQIYDCNYIMFQNSAFDTKWFYAFITSVEYVSNVSSKVSYELDVMQTWMFDYELGECFVEREHTETDEIGDNLIPERLETGEFIYSPVEYGVESRRVTPFTNLDVAVMTTFDNEFEPVKGGYHTNYYSGLAIHCFESPTQLNNFIGSATDDQKANGIVSVFMIPHELRVGEPRMGGGNSEVVGVREIIKKKLDNIDGHNVRNNKLFTMPYNSLLVTDHNGKSNTYGYEYFYDYPSVVNTGYITFEILSSMANLPEYCIVPWFYKGLEQNHLERIVLSETPMCGFNIDTFRDWLAQNKRTIMVDTFADTVGMLAGITSSNSAGGVVSTGSIGGVVNRLTSIVNHSQLPPVAKGNTNTGALNVNTNKFGFSLYYCTITKQYAEIIDNFFDMYGYAVNTLKKPRLNNRPYWNYIKTATCVIKGSMPANDTKAIIDIYNRGITFWNKDAIVGDYSQDNKPTK